LCSLHGVVIDPNAESFFPAKYLVATKIWPDELLSFRV
jgi:hypothetical protein